MLVAEDGIDNMKQPNVIYDRVKDQKLDRLQESIIKGLNFVNEAYKFPFGYPTDKKTENYNANFSDMVICDTTNGSFTVYLPKITKSDIGKFVNIAKIVVANNVIIASNYDLVGEFSTSPLNDIRFRVAVAVAVGQWILEY